MHHWRRVRIRFIGSSSASTLIMLGDIGEHDDVPEYIDAIRCVKCEIALATTEVPSEGILQDIGIDDCDSLIAEYVIEE